MYTVRSGNMKKEGKSLKALEICRHQHIQV